jgi:hypothetical protein
MNNIEQKLFRFIISTYHYFGRTYYFVYSIFFFFLSMCSLFKRITSRSSVPPELRDLIVDNLHVFTSLRTLKTSSGRPSAAL